MKIYTHVLSIIVLVALQTAGVNAQVSTRAVASDLERLIRDAKAEGNILFYTSSAEIAGKKIADAFSEKYGIKASFIRLSTQRLFPRHSAETETGNSAADLLFGAGTASLSYAEEGVKKGWFEPI